MTAFLLGTSLGRWLLLGAAAVLAIGVIVLLVHRQGEAAAVAAAVATALERTSAAARARATIKSNDAKAMGHDPHNRDRSR